MEANNQEQEQDLVDVVKVNDENTDEIHSEMLKKEESSLSLVSFYTLCYTLDGVYKSARFYADYVVGMSHGKFL